MNRHPPTPPIPPDLWEYLRLYLQQHPNCEITLYFHQGTAQRMALTEKVTAQTCGLPRAGALALTPTAASSQS